nr:MAG TPA: hypothetical protein [Caudoviricetes sp.]
MRDWLIDFIHNIDITCNVIFFMLNFFIFITYVKSENNTLVVGKNIRRLWFIYLIGIILIPSKEVLYKLL